MSTAEEVLQVVGQLKEAMTRVRSDEEARAVSARIARIMRKYRIQNGIGLPLTPVDQAEELFPAFKEREHLACLGDRVAAAVRDVEMGHNRMLAVSMPPRAGKSTLLSYYTPIWLLRRHPEWSIITASYDSSLTGGWARDIRALIESTPDLGVALQKDNGAQTLWKTEEGGGIFATSVRGSMTGRGARVLIIDDPVKDFIEAHSEAYRDILWNWWLSVAQTRLEAPYLVLVVMTRWHEDDFIGRLLSPDREGDPDDWENIALPALADSHNDILRRPLGEPLLSPVVEETPRDAVQRWEKVQQTVGSYTFSSMYQQHPAPAQGEIFDSEWWRFWTRIPDNATEDGSVVYLDPTDPRFGPGGQTPWGEPGRFTQVESGNVQVDAGRWLDSWDCTFKGTDSSDFVVGQRWLKRGPYRFLIDQQRGRWSFTQTLEQMKAWGPDGGSDYAGQVHEVLVEDKANGSAVIDVMRKTLSGLIPISPRESKESRARAVTPDIESHHVLLPFPGDPGNEWVADYLDEFRNFPHGTHDDQVDASTQALNRLRERGVTRMAVPRGSARGGGSVGMSRLGPGARSRVGALRTMRPRV